MVTVALDPGGTTGFSTYDGNRFNSYQINLKPYPSPHEVLYDHLSELRPSSVIYEAFHHRIGQTNVVYTGVEYIGVVKLWCQVNKIPIYSITSSTGKAFWTDYKIKALELYQRNLIHGMDALRVLLTHLSKTDNEWYDLAILKLRSTLQVIK